MDSTTTTSTLDVISADEIERALDAVQSWVEKSEYRGYEPFDGLSSWFRPLTFGNQFASRILQQAIRQCPINLRPLCGVKPQDSTKGQGYMAWGYLALYRATRRQEYLEKLPAACNGLMDIKCGGFNITVGVIILILFPAAAPIPRTIQSSCGRA